MSEFLSVTQLVEQAKEEYRRDFGTVDIPVVEPSQLVLETQRVADSEGFGFLKPFHFPCGETRLDSPTPPGWKKLNRWFFQQMTGKKPNVSPDAAKIGAYWTLFDESKRPEFAGDEKFGIILATGRDLNTIKDSSSTRLRTSRFGVSMNEQDSYVFPELAKPLRLVDHIAQDLVVIRRPKATEFNCAGNLRYRHLGEDPTWEGFDDKFAVGYRLFGGHSASGGLGGVDYGWTGNHDGGIAFRPLVVFLSQPQNLITW